MEKMTDLELIDEIRKRFEFNRNALQELRMLTQKLEEMNEKLQESEALKSHFMSNIRNEINNPLSAIMGLAGQSSVVNVSAEEWQTSAAMIYREAFNLDFQLQNIFMAAELEAGETLPSFAKVDVAAIVISCLDKLSHYFEEKALTFAREMPDRAAFVSDAQKLELILLNLLSNAAEFSAPNGTVRVLIRCAEHHLTAIVTDDGPGIDPVNQKLAFDRFRQLDIGTTKSHRGHGLGLSLCRSLTDLLGGSLTLESEPGQGTTVTLRLPVVEQQVGTVASDGNLFLFEATDDEEVY